MAGTPGAHACAPGAHTCMHIHVQISLAPSLGTEPRPSSQEAWLLASALPIFCYAILENCLSPHQASLLGPHFCSRGFKRPEPTPGGTPISVDTIGSPGDRSRHSGALPLPQDLCGTLLPAQGVGHYIHQNKYC